jgi:Mn-dependent DtxR family transcriptional regulator
LADRLGIHYSTVTAAYNHLAETGLLEIRQGSGVRVGGPPPRDGSQSASLDEIVREFFARVTDCNSSRTELVERLKPFLHPKPVRRIIAVDRNQDFHEVLLKELKPHFNMPVEIVTVEQFLANKSAVDDALIVTSLYHLHAFENAVSDPTRLVVCNIEPANTELSTVSSLPPGNLVALISVSETIMRMATKLVASMRADLGVRSVLASDRTEIEYLMKHADLVLTDSSSESTVLPLAENKRVSVFKLYSPTTIQLIKDRLAKWG